MKIAFAGDSITAAGNWAEAIDFAEVKNFAVSGDSTDALLEMIPRIVEFQPDIVSVLIGTNDFGNTLLNREGTDVGARVLAIIEEFKKHEVYQASVLQIILDLAALARAPKSFIIRTTLPQKISAHT